jgi:hypothetical protein
MDLDGRRGTNGRRHGHDRNRNTLRKVRTKAAAHERALNEERKVERGRIRYYAGKPSPGRPADALVDGPRTRRSPAGKSSSSSARPSDDRRRRVAREELDRIQMELLEVQLVLLLDALPGGPAREHRHLYFALRAKDGGSRPTSRRPATRPALADDTCQLA